MDTAKRFESTFYKIQGLNHVPRRHSFADKHIKENLTTVVATQYQTNQEKPEVFIIGLNYR